MKRRLTGLVIAAACVLLAGACGGGSSKSSSTSASGPKGTLTISNESGGQWTCGFNPYNLSVIQYSLGTIYEPLAFVNALQNAKATPWLATGWTYSNGNKTITFTIRDGVKWSDGQPLTAADVAYSFQLLKQHAALDLNSVWSVLSSVKQQGTNQVVMNFKTAAVPYFYYIADQVGIVPQHIWSTIKDPANYKDDKPVGSGPFTMSCTPQNMTYLANKNYWQKGEPKVAKVLYPAFTSNDPANTYLATGQAQWGSQFIPNIQKFYVDRDPKNHHYWFAPLTNITLFPNLTKAPLNDVAVREAMSYGIDRNKASQIGEYGYEPASNQAGIVTPTFSSWTNPTATGQYNFNPAKAEQILQAAGYKKGSDGIYVSPKGQKLSFHVINQGGYSDWVATLQAVAQQLKAVGIQLTVDNLSSDAYDARIFKGDFDLAYYGETGGPSPYYELRQWLYSANSAPIGQTAGSNFERYINPATDKLFNAYAATADPATQHSLINQIQQVMLKDVPVIPVTEGVDWYQYDTGHFSGWVTQNDPYAQPAAFMYPDIGVMLMHLKAK